MPDTLLIVLLSMVYYILLSWLPYYIRISEGSLKIVNLLNGRHKMPLPSERVLIANLALDNYKESYTLFLGLSIIGIMMGIPMNLPVLLWFIFRLIHTPCYIFCWEKSRTLFWLASLGCMTWMAIQIILLNRLTMFSTF